ncbi:hypothetical protein [Nocardioides aquiterrae]|uniref:Uncharacterized protein n=1 Tax=Nocardioides aquiterrae TaxID=203799 RepID=A0ABP4EWC0_9ACTN
MILHALVGVTLAISGGTAAPAAEATTGRSGPPAVTVSAPADRVEGDRFTVKVRIGAARKAERLSLLKLTENIYGQAEWTPVKSMKVQGRSAVKVPAVADTLDSNRFRAQVRYVDGRTVTSRPVTVTIWHWYPLGGFRSYYETPGVADYSGASFAMNGDTWVGWYTYGTATMWEARYTPGRNCKAFRGTAGVRDESSDGSSGTITLVADETDVVWESPELTPGMVAPFEVELAAPYRFAIQAHDTSVEPAYAAPAIGASEFLCNFG